jgi:hypothetical protein
MSVASPKPPPKPQPGLARTIGVLNLVFGTVLLLCGALCFNAVNAFLIQNNPLRLEPKETREVLEQMRKQMLKDLQDQEEMAGNDAERQRIKKAKADLESKSTDLAGKVDFEAINHDLPSLARYLRADAISGPLLNLGMVIAGVGLVLLKGWGRKLAIGVAALKIVRLIVLNGMLVLMVVPQMSNALGQLARTVIGDSFIKHSMEQQQAQRGNAGPAPQLTAADFVQIMRAIGYGYAVMLLGVGVIYPVVSLIVLTRPGARAACQRTKHQDDGPLVKFAGSSPDLPV